MNDTTVSFTYTLYEDSTTIYVLTDSVPANTIMF